MNIQHYPLFNIQKAEAHYTKKDGVDVKYVCTTDLTASDVPMDIFYRAEPHPEFGNRYFGLYKAAGGHLMITNADAVESFEYGLVEDDDGDLQYSQHRWDYRRFDNGNMIDGGRAYVRSNGCKIHAHVVRNGEMIYYRG